VQQTLNPKPDYENVLEAHVVETASRDWLIYFGTISTQSIGVGEGNDARCFPTDAEMDKFLAAWKGRGQLGLLAMRWSMEPEGLDIAIYDTSADRWRTRRISQRNAARWIGELQASTQKLRALRDQRAAEGGQQA
jgi:hypothetical protein